MTGPASAHSFGVVYTLPVPFWLYAWGAVATLVLSFVVVGIFATDRAAGTAQAGHAGQSAQDARWQRLPRGLLIAAQLAALAALTLTVLTGWLGSPNPYGNFNMTFFWIVFVLGWAYMTALAGNVYAAINPWRTLALAIDRLWRGFAAGRFAPPAALGSWPAVALYGAFIWLELLGGTKPHTLSHALAAYTGINLLGVWLWGAPYWFRHGEFFAVLLRLFGAMAPLRWDTDGSIQPRWPFSGLVRAAPTHWSGVVFVLFLLSATAFDGLHEARIWVELFWQDVYRAFLTGVVGNNPFVAFPQLREYWRWWQTFWLLASPWLYLAVYMLGIAGVWLIAGRREPLMTTARRFAYSLLPIVLVYHVTHYYTLIQTQGVKITALASDPFSWGWDLFGTADWYQRTIVPDVGFVWHVQVVLIVLGHVVSVYVAHLQALRWLGSRKIAAVSQLPMLILMVAFTVAGLWILSQPIKVGT